jgi:predicted aminopeptidase
LKRAPRVERVGWNIEEVQEVFDVLEAPSMSLPMKWWAIGSSGMITADGHFQRTKYGRECMREWDKRTRDVCGGGKQTVLQIPLSGVSHFFRVYV